MARYNFTAAKVTSEISSMWHKYCFFFLFFFAKLIVGDTSKSIIGLSELQKKTFLFSGKYNILSYNKFLVLGKGNNYLLSDGEKV